MPVVLLDRRRQAVVSIDTGISPCTVADDDRQLFTRLQEPGRYVYTNILRQGIRPNPRFTAMDLPDGIIGEFREPDLLDRTHLAAWSERLVFHPRRFQGAPAFKQACPIDRPALFYDRTDTIPLGMREEVHGFDKMGLAIDSVDHLPRIIKIYYLNFLPYGQVLFVVILYIERGKFK